MEKIEHVIDNSGVQIHCIEYNGSIAGTPIIMVPGMINSAEEVAAAIQAHLTKHTIILSLRGRGKSGVPQTGWTIEHQASDIAAVIHHFGFEEVVLFGHSTGGSIAARALPMLQARVRHFFLGDFPPFYPPYNDGWMQQIVSDPEWTGSNTMLEGIVREAEYTDVSEYLKPIASRLTLIAAESPNSYFPTEDIDRMQEMFPEMKVEILNGCGHMFLEDDPKRSLELIEKQG